MASAKESTSGTGLPPLQLQPGTTLLKCEPFVYAGYLDLPQRNLHFCDTCFTTKDAGLLRCKSCLEVKYCDRTCQEKGWKDGHKYECKQMQLLLRAFERAPASDKKKYMLTARLILRLIVKLQDGNDYYDELKIGGTVVKRRFADLISHHEEIMKNKKVLETVLAQLELPKDLLGPKTKIKIPSDMELLKIYGKVQTNAFEIGDGMRFLGGGLYLSSSIFNHSCVPTATRVFEGTTMYVRNVVEIPQSLPIDKVTVTYASALVPSEVRRKALEKEYHFHCECERCKTGEFDKEMRSIICSNKDCSAMIDTEEIKDPCKVCGYRTKKELIWEILEILKYATELADTGNSDFHSIESCIRKMKSMNFPDSHWTMLRLFERAYYKAIAEDSTGKIMNLEKAFEYGSKCIVGVRRYSHPYDDHLFWLLFETSSAAVFLNKLDEAEKYMVEAKSIAEVLHGKDSPFLRINKIDYHLQIIRERKMNRGMNRLVLM